MNVLIVAPNWLGDAVMALPAIADVRRASPGRSITVAARPSVRGLFSLVPDVNAHVGRVTSGYDAALLLPNSFRAAFDVWRARIPERWGYRTDCRGPLLTRAVAHPPRGVHQIEYYQQLVKALGFSNAASEPRLEVIDEVRDEGQRALTGAGWDGRSPLVALAPGAAYGGAKRWPPEYFAELAAALQADGVATVLVGSAADAAAGREIESELRRLRSERGGSRTLNLIGATDLQTLAGVLANCRGIVTNDSGAMHLAAALGVPVTAVFGPTDERATGPRGSAHAVLANPVVCRPCMLRECPIDHRCMRGVPVAAVLAEARRTL